MNRDAEIITFGCRLNIYESEILKQGVKKGNIKNTSFFNSCAVTSETLRKVKKTIRAYRSIIKLVSDHAKQVV